MIKTTSLLATLAVALGASTALAQSPAGNPSDPTTNENQQMAPNNANPADPATGASPGARVPTSPPGTGSSAGEGMSTGESGLEAPAGAPSDPNANENRQTAPGAGNPSDPAAGSNPGARAPTEGTAP
jgi:hypothetical protein